MRHLRFSFIAFLLVVAVPGLAQSDLAARLAAIEKAIDARREELHIPGLALAIVKDDKVIYSKGMGLRNVEQNLPVTTKTHFAVGSTSKAFTGMTVVMCADEGKLALTDAPKKYLPYFKINDPDIDGKITIADLLSHRSGLERTDIAWYTGSLKPREIIQVAADAKPTAKLGEKFQYQNVMFLAAGEIVAAVQKKPWRAFVAERIFKPLGMKTTNTDVFDMQRMPDFAYGYAWDAEKNIYRRLPARHITMIAPAGAINSNADEMAQWVRLMLNGGVYEGKRLVSEKGFAELTAPRMKMAPTMDYGLGWMLRTWNGHKVVEHGGNIDGFNAQVALMPDQKLGFVLLTNVSASPLGSFTMNTVWENLVGGATKTAATSPPSATGPATAPDQEVGKYQITGAPVAFDVALKDGKLILTVTGQPPYPLEPLGGRRYKLGAPAPDGFFATFRPAKDKPNTVELYVEQPHGNVAALRETSTYQAPITVEDLMKKVSDARGTAANLAKHGGITMHQEMFFETQGVRAQVLERWSGPAHVNETTLWAAGKKIARIRECFDGKEGSDEVSFASSEMKTGKALANARAESAFAPELDWKTLFKTVTITRIEKVEGEECYVVEKVVDKGDRFVDYISTKRFLPIKTESPGVTSEIMRDYRDVGGLKISFDRTYTAGGGFGTAKVTVKEVKFEKRIAASAFRPRIPSSAITQRTSDVWVQISGYE